MYISAKIIYMAKELEQLDLSSLTNLESDALVNRFLNDVDTVDKALMTDPGLNAYQALLKPQNAEYKKALLQVQKNDETAKILQLDVVRDKAYRAFVKAVNLGLTSDIEAEVEAAKSLYTLLKTFGNVPKLNFEAESAAIKKLLTDLATDKYKAHVTTLALDKYILRIKNAEDAFSAKFGGRMQDTATKEVYDTKALRTTMINTYKLAVSYVLSMANSPAAINLPLFDTVLALINTARKYYHDNYTTPKGGGGTPPPTPPTNG